MSKRRNPKKEKAQRNKAYARKFRKRQTTGRFFKNRRWRSDKGSESATEPMEDEIEKEEQEHF